uniref:Securin n=1 Tax=Geotrypetes seraphini TaxID=260995 RepID=A0A6P8Q920_GEOSA|nr:securin [Geotrypetes seraphini]XP_033783666.1 securin [Geotrypetes seraphini]XP_033783667.1 securin [Geotrypetes seraphini]XP_033783668.1 securin [Geotrypetes seraphini]
MATLIYVDKENGEVGINTTNKDRLRLPSAPSKGKSVPERFHLQTPRSGKVFKAASGLSQSARKALGNINNQTECNKATVATTKKNVPQKPKRLLSTASKKTTNCCDKSTENYPEIEKLIPYDPSDFECFDVPEEHKLSHLNLAGLPLFVLEKEKEQHEKIVNMVPSPMKMPSSMIWDVDCLQSDLFLLPTLEEMTVDLPPLCEL